MRVLVVNVAEIVGPTPTFGAESVEGDVERAVAASRATRVTGRPLGGAR